MVVLVRETTKEEYRITNIGNLVSGETTEEVSLNDWRPLLHTPNAGVS
jgi:hypothetical protein